MRASRPVAAWLDAQVRLTEFWERMDEVLGSGYARYWADTHVVAELGGRTVSQALDDGDSAYDVWRAVWRTLDLPPALR